MKIHLPSEEILAKTLRITSLKKSSGNPYQPFCCGYSQSTFGTPSRKNDLDCLALIKKIFLQPRHNCYEQYEVKTNHIWSVGI